MAAAADSPRDSDTQVLGRINELIETEHRLRAEHESGAAEDVRQQLREVETALDRCWDLLRQRRARQEFGQDPGGARARPASEVEGYRQ